MFKLIRNVSTISDVLGRRSFSLAKQHIQKTINSMQLLGRVGRNPQQRGIVEAPVVTFSFATHRTSKTKSAGFAEAVDWHQVIVFKPELREYTMQFVKKGSRLSITGRLTYNEVIGKKGIPRVYAYVIADEIICL